MAVQKQDNQHEYTFSNYVRIRDVIQITCLRRWTIGKSGERVSGISVLPAWHDDDDEDNRFKTSNLVINNNSYSSIGVLQKNKRYICTLEDCISENNNIYVSLTSTTLSRGLTNHVSDTISIAYHLKKHSCLKTEFRRILTENTVIIGKQNNKNYRFSILSISERYYQNSIESISNPVMFLNVFSNGSYLENHI